MKNSTRRENESLPETANWRLKGDGVAFTTSKEIINSKAGRALLEQASQVKLKKR